MEFPKEYPLAIAVALGMNWQMAFAGMAVPSLRKKIFNEDFMKKEFGDVHKRQLGYEITGVGYPDTGSGLYAQKLSYRDWYSLNVLQRIHYNYLESINLAQLSTLASALYKPRHAAVAGMFFILGRVIYSIFYKREKGAMNKKRILGMMLCMASLVVNSGIFFYHFGKALLHK